MTMKINVSIGTLYYKLHLRHNIILSLILIRLSHTIFCQLSRLHSSLDYVLLCARLINSILNPNSTYLFQKKALSLKIISVCLYVVDRSTNKYCDRSTIWELGSHLHYCYGRRAIYDILSTTLKVLVIQRKKLLFNSACQRVQFHNSVTTTKE